MTWVALIVFCVLLLAGGGYALWCWGRDTERTRHAVEAGRVLAEVTAPVETDPEQVAIDRERIRKERGQCGQ